MQRGFWRFPAPDWLSWTDTRKPAVFLATGSIPVGAAGDQVDRVVDAVDDLVGRYPEAAKYTSGAIL